MVNPFPHIDTFRRLCSRQLLKTLWKKEKLFMLSICQCFRLYSMIIHVHDVTSLNAEICHIFIQMYSKLSAEDMLHVVKGLNSRAFPWLRIKEHKWTSCLGKDMSSAISPLLNFIWHYFDSVDLYESIGLPTDTRWYKVIFIHRNQW